MRVTPSDLWIASSRLNPCPFCSRTKDGGSRQPFAAVGQALDEEVA
jgi:hypothetical protein